MLSVLADAIEKPVVWLGEAPSARQRALASQLSQNSTETLGEWAARWASAQNRVVEASPDALVFRNPRIVEDISGATATSNFIPTEKLQLDLMESLPDALLSRMPLWENSRLAQGFDIDASEETVPLALIQLAKPDFEARLRAWLKIFHTRAQGEREASGQTFKIDLALEAVPAERLRLGLTAHTDALCQIGSSKIILRLPVNQPCAPPGCFGAMPALPLIQKLQQSSAKTTSRVFQGRLGELFSSPSAKTRLIVANNLQKLPIVVAWPQSMTAATAATLGQIVEKAIGLQHRRVADLEYLTLANDDFTNRAHTLVSRWQMAHGVASFSFFQPEFNRPGWVKIAKLPWPARWALVNSFRQWQNDNPEEAKVASEAQLMNGGQVWFARAATLHLLVVEPANERHPAIALQHFPITLHGSTPPN